MRVLPVKDRKGTSSYRVGSAGRVHPDQKRDKRKRILRLPIRTNRARRG